MEKPKLVERLADNGTHSHWELLHPVTGDLLWSEETYCSSDMPKAFAKHGFRGYVGGRMLIFPTSPEFIEAFDKATREHLISLGGSFTCASDKLEPSAGIEEILEIRRQMQDEIFNISFDAPKLGPSFEELHPEPKKKTYKEPPWKFNKPHNHTSEPYGKSNRSGRTARKRKNHRNK